MCVCVVAEVLLICHNSTTSSLVSCRRITDATLAIVRGETIPLDVLQIKVKSSPEFENVNKATPIKKTKCHRRTEMMKTSPLLTHSYPKYSSLGKNDFTCLFYLSPISVLMMLLLKIVVKNIHRIYPCNHF